MYDYGIFIFRKDLRIIDNRGLIKLSNSCKEIIPIFIFDPYQIDLNEKNKNYLSFPALKFLCESVNDLYNNIKNNKSQLYIFYGKPKNVVKYVLEYLLKKTQDKTICLGFNQDFTKYSIERDNIIIELCNTMNIPIIINDDDSTLCSMDLLLKDTKNNIPYKQYGAFRKNLLKNKFNIVNKKNIKFSQNIIKFKKLLNLNDLHDFWIKNIHKNYEPIQIGKRILALKILKNIKNFKNYNTMRDTLSYKTTNLSAYLNFGLISERELYESAKENIGYSSLIISQIIWRDYYITLLRYLEGASSYDNHIDDRYNKIKWLNNKAKKEWDTMMESKTGFLIVDAAIKEILTTGYMHNRARLIVGVFAVKYLKINPLCRYYGLHDWFSRSLVDCCTSQNKLNCQWVTELDFPGKKFAPSNAPIAGRPMSIYNSTIKKWDPSCEYIKKWLPQLSNIDNKVLYNWDTKYDQNVHPGPMFDSKKRYQEWIILCS